MAIRDVVTLGFGKTEIAYVTLLGFTFAPVVVDGEGVLVTLPERSFLSACAPRGLTGTLPQRSLVVTLKPGGRRGR